MDFIISRIGDLSIGINIPFYCGTDLAIFLNFMETCFLLFSMKNNSKHGTLDNGGLRGEYKCGIESLLKLVRCCSQIVLVYEH